MGSIAAAVVLATVGPVAPALASAGPTPLRPDLMPTTTRSGGCVTSAEYRRVKVGMPEPRVERIFGFHGKWMFANGTGPVRQYVSCQTPCKVAVVQYFRSASMRTPLQSKAWGYICPDDRAIARQRD